MRILISNDDGIYSPASLDDESAEGKKIAEARVEIFRQRYLRGIKPTPGSAAFVEWLLASHLTVVVATSAREDEVKSLLAICDGQALVKDATTSDDAQQSKPDPDIVAAALEKSGSTADRVVMIGDTPYDVEAAGRAGLATIALRCGGWDDDALHGAIAIYDHRSSCSIICAGNDVTDVVDRLKSHHGHARITSRRAEQSMRSDEPLSSADLADGSSRTDTSVARDPDTSCGNC